MFLKGNEISTSTLQINVRYSYIITFITTCTFHTNILMLATSTNG